MKTNITMKLMENLKERKMSSITITKNGIQMMWPWNEPTVAAAMGGVIHAVTFDLSTPFCVLIRLRGMIKLV